SRALVEALIPALTELRLALNAKAEEFSDVVKSGRTHLMDAAPVTLGAEFGGYAGQVTLGVERLESSLPRLMELPLGGTAVGTGLNAPAGFADGVVERLAQQTGLPFRRARYQFEAQSARDALVETSGQLRVVALSLLKICNDLRWMGSGPHAGLGEIQLPALQPGSSIMPGKVNPVVPEAVIQICARVVGNDSAVALGATTSAFELNTAMPLIAQCVLESVGLLTNAATVLARRTITGLVANVEELRRAAAASPSIATSLNLLVGYDAASGVVKEALRRGVSIREAAQSLVDDGLLSTEQLDHALDIDRLASGG
ncbi:MAG TPA: lyase family protein, partial [Actinomycetes bacterium]|nr:lyase family protein [Actinomycetes bacterium]